MAKTSLRSYIHDIEGLIDKGKTDEAVAHCRYILQSFPKLLTAYRMMGKALLETRQYTDAADIFQRVLSSTPDDFVSQVGMSIIREDEGNLDAAIWHMERAFEVQPYNVSLQDELRRLYGRRDGVEPPKIRLTRGALARMYAKGKLYQQAIAELRAGLMEDATRVDLQVVLARMYFQYGQRIEAVDTCSALIKKSPYCLEANRILSIILPETGRKEGTQVYRQRVLALDPYLVHADPDATNSDSVAENIVMIERLDYQMLAPTVSASQPAWAASLGVNLNEFTPKKEEEVPDWLASIQQKVADSHVGETSTPAQLTPGAADTPSPFIFDETSPAQPGQPEDLRPEKADQPEGTGQPEPFEQANSFEQPDNTGLPDWMKEAGWVSSSGDAANEPMGDTFETDETQGQSENEIARANVPDWLKAIAPEGALEGGEMIMDNKSGDDELIPSGEPQKPEEPDTPDWLNDLGPAGEQGDSTLPVGQPAPLHSETGIPDWLQAVPEDEAGSAETEAPVSQEAVQPADEIPNWLIEIAEEEGPSDAVVSDEGKTTEPKEEKPVDVPVSAPLEQSVPGVNLEDQDESLAWLESLAAKQGASEEELITSPEERQEIPPSWVQEVAPEEVKAEAEAESETLVPQEFAEAPSPAIPAEVPHEVYEQELPDWLEEISGEPSPAGPGEETQPEEQAVSAEELPDWLLAMGAEGKVSSDETVSSPEQPAQAETEVISPESPIEAAPQTVTVWDEQGTMEIPVSAPLEENVPGVNLDDQDAAMAWLESLAAKQGAAEEELTTRPEERLETPPAWVEEIFEKGVPAEQAAAVEAQGEAETEPLIEAPLPIEAEEAPEAAVTPEAGVEAGEPVSTGELPDWLQELAMEETPTAPPVETTPREQPEGAALPDWLQQIGLEEEPPAQAQVEAQAEPEVQPEPVLPQPAEAELQPSPALSEEDAAMAWLESLAAKQGVPEDELTTRPEERPETPPAWVQEESVVEQTMVEEHPVMEEPATIIEQPTTLEQPPAEEQPVVEEQPPVVEQPAAEEQPAPVTLEAETTEQAAIPDWLQEIASEAETTPTLEEVFVEPEETLAVPEVTQTEPEQALPPLPSWLEHAVEEESQEELEVTAAPLVNINTASLVELEDLPGIGFILAQAIVNHRQEHGPFSRIDDLADVQGFNPGIVAEIAEKITVGQPAALGVEAAPEVKELEGIEGYEAELMKARNAMVAGDVDSTLTHYGSLIKKEQLLVEVIRDLHEALYRYPVDASIWMALGDAYMHNNQLQEALDAYTKAEELIR